MGTKTPRRCMRWVAMAPGERRVSLTAGGHLAANMQEPPTGRPTTRLGALLFGQRPTRRGEVVDPELPALKPRKHPVRVRRNGVCDHRNLHLEQLVYLAVVAAWFRSHMDTGAQIREFRENKSLTQDQMAEHLNTSRTVISRWETGFRRPDRRSLIKLAKLMGCTIDDLLEEEVTE